MDNKPNLQVVSSGKAEMKQRAAMFNTFAREEDYNELIDMVTVDTQLMDNLSAELAECFDNKAAATTRKIMQILQLDIQGYPMALIAKQLGMSESGVRNVRASDSYKLAREEVLRQVVNGARKYMEVASMKAVKTLVECLDSSNEKIKLSAAQDLLNRAGLQATQQIEITSNVNNFENFTTEQLAEIVKKEAGVPKKVEVIDVVPSTVHEG